jgi:hypothetical protein
MYAGHPALTTRFYMLLADHIKGIDPYHLVPLISLKHDGTV